MQLLSFYQVTPALSWKVDAVDGVSTPLLANCQLSDRVSQKLYEQFAKTERPRFEIKENTGTLDNVYFALLNSCYLPRLLIINWLAGQT